MAKAKNANLYCKSTDLGNEASVESFFVLRLLSDLGYPDGDILTKEAIQELRIPMGRKKELYKPDYILTAKSNPHRLTRLAECSLGRGSTLDRYLGNRIEPALSTCLAVEERQKSLAEKIERATELLNTRIGLDIQTQNKAVLSSISDTARSQFRLQRTVEGLSVIAIAYYAIGILSYVLTGVSEVAQFSKPLVIALAVPVIILGVWVFLRRMHRGHQD